MSKQQFIKSAILGSLVIGTLIFGSFKANATEFNQNIAQVGKVMLAIEYYNGLEEELPNQVAYILGRSDEINTKKMRILIS